MKKQFVINALALSVALSSGVLIGAVAQPHVNTNARRHPNLNAAQVAIGNAWNSLVAAQKANEFDLGGHAQKAKDALDTANHEIKLAAETSNNNGH